MKINILLVDDEQDFLEMFSERLLARGFSVFSAQSGEEALARVREGGIDVVILDVQMPGMDGIAILHEIKRIEPLVEVMLLTGQASVQTAVNGMKAGAFDYIMKPADMVELVEKLTNAYGRKAEQEERIRNAEIQRIMLTKSWD
jgi:DNA-binding NtrC family response regulator